MIISVNLKTKSIALSLTPIHDFKIKGQTDLVANIIEANIT